MKVQITEIALALFWWFPVYLNLDTGRTYNIVNNGDIIEKLQNNRKLPLYSRAAIYQSYLKMAQEHLGIEFGDWFNKAPQYELIADYEPTGAEDFCHEAHIAVDSFFDPVFPIFDDYFNRFILQFAKEWCEKEGYEWYEE